MRFAVVGPGRVGSALIAELTAAGYELTAVIARQQLAAGGTAPGTAQGTTGAIRSAWSHVAAEADVVFITVPDDVIGSVARQLAAIHVGARRRSATVLHCSGALTSQVLSPLRAKGWHVGSLHPLQSVNGAGQGQLTNISWGVEGDEHSLTVARRIVASLNGFSFVVPAELKAVYHAAAVMTSNYVVTLGAIGAQLMTTLGMSAEDGVRALLPLMAGALRNMAESGVPDALTGPIERGDVATVKAHRDALTTAGVNPDVWPLYRAMGVATIQVALDKGTIDQPMTEALRSVLGCVNDE